MTTNPELKTSVVYATLGYLAGKREKADREILGDGQNADVSIEVAAIVKIDGKRLTFSEQIIGHLNIGLPPDATEKTEGPSAIEVLCAVLREFPNAATVLNRIKTDVENDDLVIDKKELKSLKAFIASLQMPTNELNHKRGALTFTPAQ